MPPLSYVFLWGFSPLLLFCKFLYYSFLFAVLFCLPTSLKLCCLPASRLGSRLNARPSRVDQRSEIQSSRAAPSRPNQQPRRFFSSSSLSSGWYHRYVVGPPNIRAFAFSHSVEPGCGLRRGCGGRTARRWGDRINQTTTMTAVISTYHHQRGHSRVHRRQGLVLPIQCRTMRFPIE